MLLVLRLVNTRGAQEIRNNGGVEVRGAGKFLISFSRFSVMVQQVNRFTGT